MFTRGSDQGTWNKLRTFLVTIIILILILIIITAVIIIVLTAHETVNDLVVELPTGKIKGRKDISLKRNVSFYSFLQIPYGQPPIGELRFMPPKPAEKWDGILDCTQNTKICYDEIHDDDRETEDCLHLNVYTPVKPGSNASLSVMFYIYGNAFCCNLIDFNAYGPHYFIEEDVIIVTFSYRIGPLGYLSTNDEVILGNAGLKDQYLALKWTNENVHLFGGDPNKITIFGTSSGATSTSHQLLNKKATGLFRAAILQSASGITHCIKQNCDRSNAYKLATLIEPHFDTNCSSKELLNFFQNVDATTLDKASHIFKQTLEIYPNDFMIECPFFGPVVEPKVEDAFITELPHKLIADGDFIQVPIMMGVGSEEGLTFARHIHNFTKFIIRYEREPELFVNVDFDIDDISEKQLVFNISRQFYTDGLFANDLSSVIKYLSDSVFNVPVIRQAYLQSNYVDLYFYQFSYHGKIGNNTIYFDGTERVRHSEDLEYLWCKKNISNIADIYPQNDVTTLERYVKLLTNFAKYLNPTPEPEGLLQNITWPKFMSNNSRYLNINDSLDIRTNPKEEVYKRWIDLYANYAHNYINDTF